MKSEPMTATELGWKLLGLKNADKCKVYLCLNGVPINQVPAVDAIHDTDDPDSCVLILTDPECKPAGLGNPLPEPAGGFG